MSENLAAACVLQFMMSFPSVMTLGSPVTTIQKHLTVVRSSDSVQGGEFNAVNFHLYTAKILYREGGFCFST